MRPNSILKLSENIQKELQKLALDSSSDQGTRAFIVVPLCVNEFRHEFKSMTTNDRVASIQNPPVPTGSVSIDAWIAGLAEFISQKLNVPPPTWTFDSAYFLKEPTFIGSTNLKGYLIGTTPSAWRRRLVFCGESAF